MIDKLAFFKQSVNEFPTQLKVEKPVLPKGFAGEFMKRQQRDYKKMFKLPKPVSVRPDKIEGLGLWRDPRGSGYYL
jgi:hypothetical protein